MRSRQQQQEIASALLAAARDAVRGEDRPCGIRSRGLRGACPRPRRRRPRGARRAPDPAPRGRRSATRSTTTSLRPRSSPGVPATSTRRRSSLRTGGAVGSPLVAAAAIAGLAITALIAVFALVQREQRPLRGARRARARARRGRGLAPADRSRARPAPRPRLGRSLADADRGGCSPADARGLARPRSSSTSASRCSLRQRRRRSRRDSGRRTAACSSPAAARARTVATGEPARRGVRSRPGATCCSRGATVASGSCRAAAFDSCRAIAGGASEPISSDDASLAARADGRLERCGSSTSASGRRCIDVDHGSPATAGAISAGGRLLATGGVDRVVRIWRVSDGQLADGPEGHVGPDHRDRVQPRAERCSRRRARTGSGASGASAAGRQSRCSPGTRTILTDIAFSPDGTQVVTASRDRTARTWKAETGAALATFAGDTEAVTSAQFTAIRARGRDREPRRHARGPGMPSSSRRCTSSRISVHPSPASTSSDAGTALAATAGRRPIGSACRDGPAGSRRRAGAADDGRRARGSRRAAIDGSTVTITLAERIDGPPRRAIAPGSPPSRSRPTGRASSRRAPITTRGSGTRRAARCSRSCAATSRSSPDARFSPDGRWVVTAGPVTAGLWSATSGRLVYFLQRARGQAPVGRIRP